ncbi:glycosyltransferase family 2 protein [Saccharicrinis fermentans]|nr:glycosyltransferase family 2 protein [Saccharicrinis fermentans]
MVSIVTPMYNSARFIKTTINSVINQTYENWELLVVDDCSTDGSLEIVKRYINKDDRIKLVELSHNQGAGVARNVGIENSKGKYISFLDADDYWEPQKLEIQVDLISKKQWAGLYSGYNNVDENSIGNTSFVVPKRINFNLLKYNNYILTSTLIVKKTVVNDIRFPLMRKRQDWIFFLEILKKVEYLYSSPGCYVNYRKSSNSLSSNKLGLVKVNLGVISNYFYAGNKLKGGMHFVVFLFYYFHNKLFFLRKTKDV